ncbi:F-box/FBD/LRR-repeat protein At1g13570-like [Rutidosis leptorrhynchoides]|uniref:F-box/FBD/LRR-repeat protein At1g13570-like n=1 Tax=Rutidosis leptorrhynchoides TaxID=125765 RepID=UPI003A990B8C
MRIQRLSIDRLGTLLPNIIEQILCLIPFREAVRTCVLSKEWRYNWTKIPKVVFDLDTLPEPATDDNNFNEDNLQESADGNNLFCVVYQILLQHQGPIMEFSICIREDDTYVEVDQVMLYLSRMNTVKKLRLSNFSRIPLDVFSMQQLTDLYLHECYNLCLPETFNSLCSVTTLTIDDVITHKPTLLHLISKCPLLKTLNLLQGPHHIPSDDHCGLIELFECLHVIENLTICLWGIQCFSEGEQPRKLPTSLYNLKYMCLYDVLLGENSHYDYGMSFLALVFRASPNVEKIKLQTFTLKGLRMYPMMLDIDSDEDEEWDVGEDYSDIKLKNLTELEIEDLGSKKVELEFVKLMLLMSPVLKTLKIFLNKEVAQDKELEMLNFFLSCPHASPVVIITLHRDV